VALTSMTGFADLAGGTGGLSWNWEARSVNGRGLDVRLRLADGFESLDSTIRSAAARHMSRGSVSIGLQLAKGTAGSVPRLNPAALEAAVAAALAASEVASRSALDLAPMTAADLLGMRGVLETEPMAPGENEAVLAQLTGEAETLLSALAASRTAEGVVDEILAEDFLCSNPDGSLVDRAAFLAQTARPVTISNLEARDVMVRLLGDVAIIHARTTYTLPDGRQGAGRYTDVWARRAGRWLAVSAHVTRA
jgi:hypothetical protein